MTVLNQSRKWLVFDAKRKYNHMLNCESLVKQCGHARSVLSRIYWWCPYKIRLMHVSSRRFKARALLLTSGIQLIISLLKVSSVFGCWFHCDRCNKGRCALLLHGGTSDVFILYITWRLLWCHRLGCLLVSSLQLDYQF